MDNNHSAFGPRVPMEPPPRPVNQNRNKRRKNKLQKRLGQAQLIGEQAQFPQSQISFAAWRQGPLPEIALPILPSWPLPPQSVCIKSTGLSILPGQGYLVYAPGCPVVLLPFWMMAPMLSMQPEILPERSIGGEGPCYEWDTPQPPLQPGWDPVHTEFSRKLASLPAPVGAEITSMMLCCISKHHIGGVPQPTFCPSHVRGVEQGSF